MIIKPLEFIKAIVKDGACYQGVAKVIDVTRAVGSEAEVDATLPGLRNICETYGVRKNEDFMSVIQQYLIKKYGVQAIAAEIEKNGTPDCVLTKEFRWIMINTAKTIEDLTWVLENVKGLEDRQKWQAAERLYHVSERSIVHQSVYTLSIDRIYRMDVITSNPTLLARMVSNPELDGMALLSLLRGHLTVEAGDDGAVTIACDGTVDESGILASCGAVKFYVAIMTGDRATLEGFFDDPLHLDYIIQRYTEFSWRKLPENPNAIDYQEYIRDYTSQHFVNGKLTGIVLRKITPLEDACTLRMASEFSFSTSMETLSGDFKLSTIYGVYNGLAERVHAKLSVGVNAIWHVCGKDKEQLFSVLNKFNVFNNCPSMVDILHKMEIINDDERNGVTLALGINKNAVSVRLPWRRVADIAGDFDGR